MASGPPALPNIVAFPGARRPLQVGFERAELMRILKKNNVYVLGEIKQNAANWDNRRVFNILGLLREYDAKSKGMNAGGASDGELLRELLLKIFLL